MWSENQREVSFFRHFLLEDLPPGSREKLLENVVFTTIPKGRYIFREGQPADFVCVIRRGKVKLSHIDTEGRENIVMIVSENDTIWENMFLCGSTFPYSAVTMTDTMLCRIYRENFLHVLDDPAAALQIVSMLSRKLHDANARNQILAIQDPLARVAGFLLYHVERGNGEELSLRLEDIASSIGLRQETVSRKLGVLQDRGFVERTGRGKLTVKKPVELAAMVETCC